VTEPDVEMAAPTTDEEPPTGPSSSEASQISQLADPSAPNSELVKDTLSNTESEELNRYIKNGIAPWTKDRDEEGRADTYGHILRILLRKYSELDGKYIESREVGKLLNNNTWLPPFLDKCWEKGKFSVIRRLSECLLCFVVVINVACGNSFLIQRSYGLQLFQPQYLKDWSNQVARPSCRGRENTWETRQMSSSRRSRLILLKLDNMDHTPVF